MKKPNPIKELAAERAKFDQERIVFEQKLQDQKEGFKSYVTSLQDKNSARTKKLELIIKDLES